MSQTVWKAKARRFRGHEDGGEVALSVAEFVLDVVTLGLENVEGFVLDFPAGPPAGGEFGDIVGSDRKVGDGTRCDS